MIKLNILLTGCAGFIGSNFVRTITTRPDVKSKYNFHIVDSLTYAGNYISIKTEIENNDHLAFSNIDIRDNDALIELFSTKKFSGIINFAAESHVDRSIQNPNIFVETNVVGTQNLLNLALKEYDRDNSFTYLQISTDEVYGSLKPIDPAFTESTSLKPNSPYSASKASADMLVRSYFKTYGLPCIITRCSNNYGPFQFPEKLIPLMIFNASNNIKLPVYGNGKNIRDWIHVHDHNDAVWEVFSKGKSGEVYNIGGLSEVTNIEVVKNILQLMNKPESLIEYVTDRPGHDFRYAMDISKIKNELGWAPKFKFLEGLKDTIEWYIQNRDWVIAVSK